MRHALWPIGLVLLLLGSTLVGEEPARITSPPGMKGYYLILLTAEGDAKRMGMSPEGKALFGEHRAFVGRRLAAREFLIAGPVTDSSALTGLAVVAAKDEAQARAWEDEDPLVKSGKFRYEVHLVLLQSLDVLKYETPN